MLTGKLSAPGVVGKYGMYGCTGHIPLNPERAASTFRCHGFQSPSHLMSFMEQHDKERSSACMFSEEHFNQMQLHQMAKAVTFLLFQLL